MSVGSTGMYTGTVSGMFSLLAKANEQQAEMMQTLIAITAQETLQAQTDQIVGQYVDITA